MGIFTAMKAIGPEMILQRRKDLLFNTIDEEVVMLSIENSEYYGMDKVGSRIWELLEQSLTFKELIGKLMDEYEVSEELCIKDTMTFINKLSDKLLIIID